MNWYSFKKRLALFMYKESCTHQKLKILHDARTNPKHVVLEQIRHEL